jgi:hypothetical protein
MSWVERFLYRNQDHLIFRWRPNIDRVRHEADSVDDYASYFDLLHNKMEQYRVQSRLTFNMDGKDFMIGVEAKSKRVFSKLVWVEDGARAPNQDGNREWVSIIPTICADGTNLLTPIIFPSEGYDIWDS